LRLEFGQVGGCHLAALAGNLEQAVLVNQPLDAGRQIECLPCLGVLGIFRPKTTKCSGGPAVCGLQRGITFFEIPIWALFE
ncbi:hypothetical protein K6W81_24035, partial [Enterobacter sp. MW07]|nr:hypothetical protein [Enterobacter sp. MW07]